VTALVTERLHDLASTLSELKVRVRAAIASELGRAIGAAVRDVLVVALTQRLATPAVSTYSGGWREEERDQWGQPRQPRDPWDDEQDELGPCRPVHLRDKANQPTAVPAAAAVAVGVHVSRWWLARHGGLTGAVAAGVLVTILGVASGPVARAALAVLAAAADVLAGGSSTPTSPNNSY
jgi:hypothetical protein